MQSEKIYFEDDNFLISSKRLVTKWNAATYLMNEISEPQFKEVWRWQEPFEWIFGPDKYRRLGMFCVIVKVKKKKVVVAQGYFFPCTTHHEKWGLACYGRPSFEERKAYYKNLSIAIGAALAGA